MNASNSFLKTLKRIGYLEADYLEESDFESMVSEKELKSFFEVFCYMNEKNVLTTEEIEEYSSLSSEELAQIEKLEKDGRFSKNCNEYENRKEFLFLQEQLTRVENHNKLIEKKIEDFKKHEEDLLEEKECQQNLLLNTKKRFQIFEISKVIQSDEEFVSSIKSIMEIAQHLQNLIMHTDTNDSKLPTSNFFKDIVQQYLDVEEKIFQCVNAFLQNNFQLHESKTNSFITEENICRKEFRKEAMFLKKRLKNSMSGKVVNEKELQKFEAMMKIFEDARSYDLNCHSSQLRYKLEKATKLNEQLKKKEKELTDFVHEAISKYVDALFTEIDSCVINETCDLFQFCVEKISLPMTILLHQRARIEMLFLSLIEHKGELQLLKKLIEEVVNQIRQEQSGLQNRKVVIEKTMSDTTLKISDQCLEIVLTSLYKILAVSEDFEDKVDIKDVEQKISKFLEAKENLKKMHEEKLKTIDSLEKYALSMESLLDCPNKEYSDWHEMEQTMNTNLNNLEVKLTSLEESISECNQDLEQKQKLLERKGNLRLARNLYVYALTDMELFKKYIEDIKVAIENSADYNGEAI